MQVDTSRRKQTQGDAGKCKQTQVEELHDYGKNYNYLAEFCDVWGTKLGSFMFCIKVWTISN